jgi:uncharacterized protein YidB (DUF937 family)
MGLFDEVLSGLEAQGGQHAALFEEVANLVKENGGVGGLAQQFQQKGLDGFISGCVGTGSNPPITGDQIVQVIGQDRIAAIAARVGLSEPQVAEGISKILPLMISHLTPNGTVQDQGAGELEGALGMLKSKLFGA